MASLRLGGKIVVGQDVRTQLGKREGKRDPKGSVIIKTSPFYTLFFYHHQYCSHTTGKYFLEYTLSPFVFIVLCPSKKSCKILLKKNARLCKNSLARKCIKLNRDHPRSYINFHRKILQ